MFRLSHASGLTAAGLEEVDTRVFGLVGSVVADVQVICVGARRDFFAASQEIGIARHSEGERTAAHFAGSIDGVRLYNRALDIVEIQTNMLTPP